MHIYTLTKIYLASEAIWNISSGHPSEKVSIQKARTGNTEATPNITDPSLRKKLKGVTGVHEDHLKYNQATS